MKILFCAYRQWAKNIYNNLNKDYDLELCESQSDLHNLNPKNYRMVLFVGWSDIVNSNWTDNVECICVHPSELPKYRGGSPIQNQIIAGEKWSAISLFKMNDKIDIIGALRSDQHTWVEGNQISPRAALIYKVNPQSTFRATYNKAFESPSALNFSLDLFAARMPISGPLGYDIVGTGNRNGLNFTDFK